MSPQSEARKPLSDEQKLLRLVLLHGLLAGGCSTKLNLDAIESMAQDVEERGWTDKE